MFEKRTSSHTIKSGISNKSSKEGKLKKKVKSLLTLLKAEIISKHVSNDSKIQDNNFEKSSDSLSQNVKDGKIREQSGALFNVPVINPGIINVARQSIKKLSFSDFNSAIPVAIQRKSKQQSQLFRKDVSSQSSLKIPQHQNNSNGDNKPKSKKSIEHFHGKHRIEQLKDHDTLGRSSFVNRTRISESKKLNGSTIFSYLFGDPKYGDSKSTSSSVSSASSIFHLPDEYHDFTRVGRCVSSASGIASVSKSSKYLTTNMEPVNVLNSSETNNNGHLRPVNNYNSRVRKSSSTLSVALSRTSSMYSVRETNEISKVDYERMKEIVHKVKDTLGVEPEDGIINQYAIIKHIGQGSFGRVLLAYNTEDERYYACKSIDKKKLMKKNIWHRGPQRCKSPGGKDSKECASTSTDTINSVKKGFDYMDMVKREIAILKKVCTHPNIAKLIEVLNDQRHDHLYMVFELCEYGSIMKIRMNSTMPPFTENLSRHYFQDVLMGLEFLHSMNIVHRDLKPDNIMLNASNHAVIGDFSISCCLDDLKQEDNNTAMLTPLFTPPEMINVKKHRKPCAIDSSIDIWALGATLFCFLHGKAPFESPEITTLYEMILNLSIVPLIDPSLSNAAAHLLTNMMEKNPQTRYTISDIRKHFWTTNYGNANIPSVEENCSVKGFNMLVTDDEINNAVKPAVRLLDKIKYKIKETLQT
jgi:serine/threonine protein kinase